VVGRSGIDLQLRDGREDADVGDEDGQRREMRMLGNVVESRSEVGNEMDGWMGGRRCRKPAIHQYAMIHTSSKSLSVVWGTR